MNHLKNKEAEHMARDIEPPLRVKVDDEVEWLQQVFHNLHHESQAEMLDCLYSIAITDDEDIDQRNTEKQRLVRAVEKAKSELVG